MKFKIRDCFEMRQIADDYIVIPRGPEMLEFNATIVLNDTGVFLWSLLNDYIDVDTLSKSLSDKYSIDTVIARDDTEKFLKKLLDEHIVEIKEQEII